MRRALAWRETCAMVEPVETVEAWQCVGCGRLQAERPCIGVCTDKKIELV